MFCVWQCAAARMRTEIPVPPSRLPALCPPNTARAGAKGREERRAASFPSSPLLFWSSEGVRHLKSYPRSLPCRSAVHLSKLRTSAITCILLSSQIEGKFVPLLGRVMKGPRNHLHGVRWHRACTENPACPRRLRWS